jgi:hypothetical protein
MVFDSVDQLFADGFVAGGADMDRHLADILAGLLINHRRVNAQDFRSVAARQIHKRRGREKHGGCYANFIGRLPRFSCPGS